jgi:hypothetical protein
MTERAVHTDRGSGTAIEEDDPRSGQKVFAIEEDDVKPELKIFEKEN